MSLTKYVKTALRNEDEIKPSDLNFRAMVNHTTSVLDIFEWCKELGVEMEFGLYAPEDKYFIRLNKDKMFTSLYFSGDMLRQQPTQVYHQIIRAGKNLDTAIAGRKTDEKV